MKSISILRLLIILAASVLAYACDSGSNEGNSNKDDSSQSDGNNTSGENEASNVDEMVEDGSNTVTPGVLVFSPSETPPELSADVLSFEATAAGADYDFTGALAVATLAINSVALLQTEGEYKKITGVGTLKDIAVGIRKPKVIKRSSKNRLAVIDGDDKIVLVDSDGTESEISRAFQNEYGSFSDSGAFYYVDQNDKQLYVVAPDSSTPEKVIEANFDRMFLEYTSGSAVRYGIQSGNVSKGFTYFQGINFSFAACNLSGPVTALGEVGLIFDDCSGNNFAYRDGDEIKKENIVGLMMNGGGFWHKDGAILFGQNQVGVDCPFNRFGIVFVNAKKEVKPIGCAPDGSAGARTWDFANGSSDVAVSDNFFVVKGTNEIWAYGINSWQQKLLDGFTPINISLVGKILYYDGLSSQGKYIVGKIDIVTKEKVDLEILSSLSKLFGLSK